MEENQKVKLRILNGHTESFAMHIHGHKPTVITAISPQFITLFGDDQYQVAALSSTNRCDAHILKPVKLQSL